MLECVGLGLGVCFRVDFFHLRDPEKTDGYNDPNYRTSLQHTESRKELCKWRRQIT